MTLFILQCSEGWSAYIANHCLLVNFCLQVLENCWIDHFEEVVLGFKWIKGEWRMKDLRINWSLCGEYFLRNGGELDGIGDGFVCIVCLPQYDLFLLLLLFLFFLFSPKLRITGRIHRVNTRELVRKHYQISDYDYSFTWEGTTSLRIVSLLSEKWQLEQ